MHRAVLIAGLVLVAGAVNKYLIRSLWPGTTLPR